MNGLDLAQFIDNCKSTAYAGIGSRQTPPDVLALMTRIAQKLDAMGWTLRSGGADGADYAFALDVTPWRKELYLPWPGFNRCTVAQLQRPAKAAYEIAAKFHPNWNRLRESAMALHARNVHQVLGADCTSPSAFVVCWTPDGSIGETSSRTGGTGQAIRIAHAYGIPIFNLRRADHREAWERFVL